MPIISQQLQVYLFEIIEYLSIIFTRDRLGSVDE